MFAENEYELSFSRAPHDFCQRSWGRLEQEDLAQGVECALFVPIVLAFLTALP